MLKKYTKAVLQKIGLIPTNFVLDLPVIENNDDLVIRKYNNIAEFNQYVNENRDISLLRDQTIFLLSELAKKKRFVVSYLLKGYNSLINEHTFYEFRYNDHLKWQEKTVPYFREQLFCSKTGLNSRLRGTLLIIKEITSVNKGKSVYLTEQVTSFFDFFGKHFPNINLIGSEYLGDNYEGGSYHNKVRHEDLTALSFTDNQLDIIVSLEVLEHIPNYLKSLSEIHRCLKPGGELFLSTPFDVNIYEHLIMAELKDDGELIHYKNPPEYHGNPIDPQGGSLCFRYYGWKLIEELQSVGFKEVNVRSIWSLTEGIMANQEYFLIYAKK